MSVMELGHLLTRSGLTYLEVSSEVCHDSFCQLGNSVPLSWVVCREAFCLHDDDNNCYMMMIIVIIKQFNSLGFVIILLIVFSFFGFIYCFVCSMY